jgi:hypothetical protein
MTREPPLELPQHAPPRCFSLPAPSHREWMTWGRGGCKVALGIWTTSDHFERLGRTESDLVLHTKMKMTWATVADD